MYSEEGVNHGARTDDKTWCVMVMICWELFYFSGFIMYFEEGVHHGKRTYDKTWCAMVMEFRELLLVHWFYNVF